MRVDKCWSVKALSAKLFVLAYTDAFNLRSNLHILFLRIMSENEKAYSEGNVDY